MFTLGVLTNKTNYLEELLSTVGNNYWNDSYGLEMTSKLATTRTN